MLLKLFQLQTLNCWLPHGFSDDAAAEELTGFANQVVGSQEDFASWREDTHTQGETHSSCACACICVIQSVLSSINTLENTFFFKMHSRLSHLQFVFFLTPTQTPPPELRSRMRTGQEPTTFHKAPDWSTGGTAPV